MTHLNVKDDNNMSEIREKEQDTACEPQSELPQSKSSTRDWNWELIIISSILTIFIALFVVYCSKEHAVCNRCMCETDLILKLSEKLTELERTVEELKGKDKLAQLGQPVPTYSYIPGPTVNIAKEYSRVSQSSEFPKPQYPAHLAIDGNRNTFAHTASEQNPWWKLEFCNDVIVAMVTMINRHDCCDDEMSNIVITVDDNFCGEIGGSIGIGKIIDVKCQKPLRGKVVKVMRKANHFLSFSEIQIYSTTIPC